MKVKQKMLAWGIALAILGIDFVGLIKAMLVKDLSVLSILVMILSLMLMVFSGGRHTYHYLKINTHMMWILVYSFATVILAFLSPIGYMQAPGGLIYQGYYFAQILFLWLLAGMIDRTQLMKAMLFLSSLLVAVSLVLTLQHAAKYGNLFSVNLGVVDEKLGISVISRSTVGHLSFVGLTVGLSVRNENRMGYFLRKALILMSLCMLVLANRRSMIIAALVVLFFHIRNLWNGSKRVSVRKLEKFMLLTAAAAVAGVLLYRLNPSVQAICEQSVASLKNGILTLLGQGDLDRSSGMRHDALLRILNNLKESTVFQLLFGHGYMDEWIDFPHLQAFWDLGLIGGMMFVWVQFFIPLKYMLKKRYDPAMKFAQYFMIGRFVENFVSGTCYGVFLPVVLMLALSSQTAEKRVKAV